MDDLHGATVEGGVGGVGTVFQLTPLNGSWPWRPYTALAERVGRRPLLRWTAWVIFMAQPVPTVPMSKATFSNWLHREEAGRTPHFTTFAASPAAPTELHLEANVIFDRNGNLYGTAVYGGAITKTVNSLTTVWSGRSHRNRNRMNSQRAGILNSCQPFFARCLLYRKLA
jgi:hypothetical protein